MLVNPLNARNQLLWIEIQSKGNKLVPELTDVNEHYDQGLFVCFSQQIIWTSRIEESRSPAGLNLFFFFKYSPLKEYMFIPIIPASL